ncbi:DUF1854 domain-containing protein [Sutcliffiella horikoshii]|uniref:DUF1854 domain-containing protein n=1 Tax=Sutcliffiella horikoshii TaxID=79883 RepID=A0AA95B6U2_9BACI|nr:DUF1854 domain-containing protein [Sutcliffiella horikoshii]TYS60107.1 DUF1854 domain-containing protein [Sutcliffiella horikoshii]
MSGDYDITYFEPQEVEFFYGKGTTMHFRHRGTDYANVGIFRTFPFSKPYEYISIWNEDTELGVIKSVDQLDDESEAVLKRELHVRYVVPEVKRIQSIKEEPGLWIFALDTDRGPLKLMMRNIHEHLDLLPPNRIIITDMDGKRCEITNIKALDLNSRKELSKVI